MRTSSFAKGASLSDLPALITRETKVKVERVYRSCRRNRRGTAAVEFALVAPLFFLLVFGMIEFGRMVMVQQVLTNASREGARLAVLDNPNPGPQVTAEIRERVQDYLASAHVQGANVAINPDPPTSAGYGEPVSVTVSVPFSQVSWLPSSFFGNGSTVLTATTAMRRETVQ